MLALCLLIPSSHAGGHANAARDHSRSSIDASTFGGKNMMSHFNEAGMDSSLTDFTAQNQVYESILAGIVVCTSHGVCSDVLGIPPASHTYLNSLVQMMSLMMKKHIEGNICLMPAIRSQDRGGLCLVVYPMFMLLLGRHFSCG